jgi:paraquat-inducible protein B
VENRRRIRVSEYDDFGDRRKDEHPEAEVHVARWNPWIWVIPILAVFFVGYLIVRYGFFGGGDITVRFMEARGLDRYSPVRFRGAKVGTVQKITIDEEMKQVVVRISMDASMNHALRTGTRFWIVEPGLEGGVGGILSGTYVGISPGEGEETREFVGQEYAPVLAAPEAGKTVILEARSPGGLGIGSPVHFNGIRVGRILGTEYDGRRGLTLVHAFIVQRFADSIRQSTRFYRGGSLNLSLSGGGVSMGGGLSSLLSAAPVAYYTPEVLAGAPVAAGTRFTLFDSEAAAIASSDGPHLTYLTYFPGPVRGLTAGTPVQIKGVQVGRVRDVRLRYIPATASLETPVVLEIDPRRMEIEVTNATSRPELRARMNDVMGRLVQRGLRAKLASSLVFGGAGAVSLEFAGAPGTARLGITSDPPVIPAVAGGDGIEGALDSISSVAATIRDLPLREIAESTRSAAARADALFGDPLLRDSIVRLNRSLTEVERVAAVAGQNIGPLAESLRNAATSAEAAAKRAEELIGTSQRQNYDLAELVKEMTRAAEAVRALANYLTENPDSLLKGRPKP